MGATTRKIPVYMSLAVIFVFFTLCLNYGLRNGGSLLSIAESAALTMAYPIQKAIDKVFQTSDYLFSSYINLVGTEARNRQLEHENARLAGELVTYSEIKLENQRLRSLLSLKKRNDFMVRGLAARVIGRQTDDLSRILIIDQGSNRGLELDNPVFVAQGLSGRIVALGPFSAKVLLLIDRNSACDVMIQRNRCRGILQGQGKSCRLAYLQQSADIKVGDQLVTTGLDNIFPKGVGVGRVVSVNSPANNLSQEIIVEPEFDFTRIEEVYVVCPATASAATD